MFSAGTSSATHVQCAVPQMFYQDSRGIAINLVLHVQRNCTLLPLLQFRPGKFGRCSKGRGVQFLRARLIVDTATILMKYLRY